MPEPLTPGPVSDALPGVEFRGLRQRFGDVVALAGIDATVAVGEFITVLGPSGSGKTTMLMTIAGFEDPDEGALLIHGCDVAGVPPAKRDIGLVFQSYALFPHMTVFNNVAYSLRARRRPKAEVTARVADALARVRLTGLEHRRPHQLSGGQQQRVALARAIVFNPSILLLDEPLGALDKQLRTAMQVELRALHASLGLTTIAVTHDQEEALTMSDRVMVLHDGRVEQFSPPEELYQRPVNRFVAEFLGASNFVKGTVGSCQEDRAVLVTATGAHLPLHAAGLRDGERVVTMIRPERIRLCGPDAGRVHGAVRLRVYSGNLVRYHVSTPTAGDIVVVDLARTTTYQVGDRVSLDWDADALWCLPGERTLGASEATPSRLSVRR